MQQDGGTGTGTSVYPQPVAVCCGHQVLFCRVPPTPGHGQLVRSRRGVRGQGGEGSESVRGEKAGGEEELRDAKMKDLFDRMLLGKLVNVKVLES